MMNPVTGSFAWEEIFDNILYFTGSQVMLLGDIAQRIEGELDGPADKKISGISSLEMAGPAQISFAVKPSMLEALKKSKAGAFILPLVWPEDVSVPCIRVKDPYLAYAYVSGIFKKRSNKPRNIHESVVMGSDSVIGKDVDIGAFTVIGDRVVLEDEVTIHNNVSIGNDVFIGRGSVIYPNTTLYSGSRLGERVIIHAGAVIGADGFGYARDGDRHVKIEHSGTVVLEDDVEIGANSTVDRAAFGETRIGAGTKIDNLVMIAHNVKVGSSSVIVSQTGISGSVEIGRGVVLGGQAGIAGHITIGDGVMVGAKSGVGGSLPAGGVFTGYPAMPHRLFLRVSGLVKKLPDMARDLKLLKQKIEELNKDKGL